MKWQAVLSKIDNGFIVEYWDGEGRNKQVYQIKYTPEPEENKEHIVEMFYDLLEFYGEIGSKHDKKRLSIKWEESRRL